MDDDLTKKVTAEFLQDQIEAERQRALNAEKVAEQVKQDMASLIAEFADSNDEESAEKVRKNIRGRIPNALIVLDELIVTGSDNIKANIAKFFIDRGLAITGDPLTDETAKLNKLLESLKVDK